MVYSKSRIQKDYAKVAWVYDFWSFLTETRALKKSLEFAEIKDKEAVLEVAVGTGRAFKKIVELNPNGRNEGIDISEDMIKVARKRLRKYKHFKLKRGEAGKLPYKSNSFDILINSFMLDLLPEKDYKAILKEYKRVLKKNGRVVITTMTNGREWYSRFWDMVARKFPAVLTGCRPVDLEKEIKKAGFTIEKSEYITQNTFPSLVIYAGK